MRTAETKTRGPGPRADGGVSPQAPGTRTRPTDAPPPSGETRLRSCAKALKLVPASRRAFVSKRCKIVPIRYRLGYLEAVAGVASPRQAVKAQCLECCGWNQTDVDECTAYACPLYAYRPISR